jgi:uncharacterized protein
MKRIILVSAAVGLALAGITGVSGCTAPPSIQAQTSPLSVNINSQEGIWVSGQGKISVDPDISTLTLGVAAQSSSVADAQSQAASAMTKLVSSLTGNGLSKNDIKTQYFSIQQLTRYDNNTQQSVVTGYQVSNVVTAKIRALDKVGAIIDAAAAAGGNLTRVNGLDFSVEQPDKYYSQVRQLAVNDAKTKAQQLAGLAAVTLGKVSYLSENFVATPISYASPGLATASVAPAPVTPISPGQIDITLNVQVAYAIQ